MNAPTTDGSLAAHSGPTPCYADRAWTGTAEVLENVRIARDTYRIRLAAPHIAQPILPGQFVMLRLSGSDDPLLARPLALYDVIRGSDGTALAIDVVYLVVGRMTRRLACCTAGQMLEIWGPLGNGFGTEAVEHLILVAGGIGQTPFLTVAQEALARARFGQPPRTAGYAGRVTFCYGVRSRDYLAGVEDFARLGVDVRLSTDDGSAGHHGFVTEVLTQLLEAAEKPAEEGGQSHFSRSTVKNWDSPRRFFGSFLASPARESRRIACCGPEPMMAAVARIAAAAAVPCQVSLETPMACGLGICFSCVARVRDDAGGWDYRRTCVEGPVFDAARIEF